MNSNVLAGLINRLYHNFDSFTFSSRIKLQKFVYILQHMFNLNIGYSFKWYHYGPYSIELMRDGFNAEFSKTLPLEFADQQSEIQFKNFISFIESYKEDIEKLEIISSIHFLHKLDLNEEEIVSTIKQKRLELNDKEQEIKFTIQELKTGGFL